MQNANLKKRWASYANELNEILKISEKGGELRNTNSPFGLINNLIDFRGINFGYRKIRNLNVTNADFSDCSFEFCWIEECHFLNSKFENCKLSEFSDHENKYLNTLFIKSNFSAAGLGYGGSIYNECDFVNSSFRNAIFIRPEFTRCNFENCRLTGVDFNASSFENCDFSGQLNKVWFRGWYAYQSDITTFGQPKPNKMKNVSFENAVLKGVDFSNGCDLSSVILPKNGNYYFIRDWQQKLNELLEKSRDWPEDEQKDANVFSKVSLVHADHQPNYILNFDELQEEYGANLAKKILITLQDDK